MHPKNMAKNKNMRVSCKIPLLVLFLSGCSSNSSTKDTKTTEVAKKNEVKTIGQKSTQDINQK